MNTPIPLAHFFLLDKKGKLLALRSVVISDDGAAFRPTAIPTDLTAMYPLVSAIEASSISLSVTYGPSPHSHFVMQVNIAGQKKTIRAPGGTLDILTEALENDTFPIVARKLTSKKPFMRVVKEEANSSFRFGC